jgi:predicted MFS family arabinose efflux permease
MVASTMSAVAARTGATPRSLVIGLMGFLTLVDLFAAQAILPSLVEHYGVSRAAMGFAVNASTMGMAASGLLVSLIARRIDRRRGTWLSLALLAIPTTLLASAPDLVTFTALRVLQGVFMAAAFTLTMTYLAERAGPADTAAALAAYITGVVASNLIGRLVAGSVADMAGLATNFHVFAGLNIAGAVLVAITLQPDMKMPVNCSAPRPALAAWALHLANPALRAAFAIGFVILFVFIGTFTYVNFELSKAPLSLSPMHLGFVYLVFLPAMVTTPMAGRAVRRLGARPTLRFALIGCVAALPMLLSASLSWVLAGLAVMGVGTFFAQAVATGFVGSAARSDRAAASGLYLAAYYLGGMFGAAVLGQVYDRFDWGYCVAVIGLALLVAFLLSTRIAAPKE